MAKIRPRYGIAETNFNVRRNTCYSFQYTDDVENGTFMHMGELLPDQKDIYNAVLPVTANLASKKAYFVANPAWIYDVTSRMDLNEDQFINEAERAFRVYDLRPLDKITVCDYSIDHTADLAVGQYVQLQDGSGRLTATAIEPTGVAFYGQIVRVWVQGYNFAMGMGDVDQTTTKVMIRVIKNLDTATETNG